MSDLIDREQAKDAIDKYLVGRNLATDGTMMARLINGSVIDRLPSAEPQIIRCKDCEYYTTIRKVGIDIPVCGLLRGTPIRHDDDFCSKADRRTEWMT